MDTSETVTSKLPESLREAMEETNHESEARAAPCLSSFVFLDTTRSALENASTEP